MKKPVELINTKSDKTFEDFDQLYLKPFGDNLLEHIIAEYPYVDGSLVISLNGKFGSGKSCFLEMFKNQLENNKKHDVIYINAWKNDFFNEPVVTIASEIIDYLNKKKNVGQKLIKGLKETLLATVGSFAISTNQLINHFTGIDIKEGAEAVEEELLKRDSKMGHTIFREYVEKSNLFEQLNKSLEKYIAELESKPLIILIDELDRARPDYAVSFLETLKHFFWTNGIVFILGVDKKHLEYSVKSLYGNINFPEYYRKFVHRNVNLPPLDEKTNRSYIEAKIEEHFNSKTRSRFFITEIDENIKVEMCDLCTCFNLSPRQMDEFFRILSHFLSKPEGSSNKVLGVMLSAMIYIAILLNNEDNAKKIVSDKLSFSEYLDLFEEVGFKKVLTGYSIQLAVLKIVSNEKTYKDNINIFIKRFFPKITIADSNQDYLQKVQDIRSYRQKIIGMGLPEVSMMSKISKRIDMCMSLFD